MTVRILKLRPDAVVPTYATPGSAAFDLYAPRLDEARTFSRRLTVRTGLAFAIPAGYAMFIFSRSGHGFNHDLRLANCVGVIDSDYRGEVQVKLTNDNPAAAYTIDGGDRIAQALVLPVERVEFELADALDATVRGTGGFGSTGA